MIEAIRAVRNSPRVEAWLALGGPSSQDIRTEQIFSVLLEEAKMMKLIINSRQSSVREVAQAIVEETILLQVRDLRDPIDRAIALTFFERKQRYFKSATLAASQMHIGNHSIRELGWSKLSPFFEIPLERDKGLARVASSCQAAINFL